DQFRRYATQGRRPSGEVGVPVVGETQREHRLVGLVGRVRDDTDRLDQLEHPARHRGHGRIPLLQLPSPLRTVTITWTIGRRETRRLTGGSRSATRFRAATDQFRAAERSASHMRKLIYSALASLDGYVEDEYGKFDWAAPDEELHAFVNDLERPIGTHLYGRRMYETMVYWETDDDDAPVARDYGEIWRAAEKIVYSRT